MMVRLVEYTTVNARFDDITSRIEEEPQWWDSNGTPRYGKFKPDACPCIYSDTVVLLRISCQYCGEEFLVEMHRIYIDDNFVPKKLHYGDPPAHGCVGDTMNCNDIEVVKVYDRKYPGKWKRERNFEGSMQ